MQIASIFLAAAVSLASPPDTLEVVSITADRRTFAMNSAPVREATSASLERRGVRGVDEVLRTFAGVSIKDYGGVGGLKTVSIRNIGAQHTAVLFDGFAVSDAQNGQVDIGRFSVDALSSLSVEIGTGDDIFRSARLLSSAGTLVMQSSRPEFAPGSPGFHATARMRVASFGTYNPFLRLETRLGRRWSAAASANYLRTDGVYPFRLVNGNLVTEEQRLNSDVSSLDAGFDVFGNVGMGGEVHIKAMYLDSERGLPGSVVLYVQDPHERLWDRNLQLNAGYRTGFGSGWQLREDLGFSNAFNRYLDTNPSYPAPQEDNYLQREFSSSTVLLKAFGNGLSFSLAEDLAVNHLDSDLMDCPYPTRLSSVSALSLKYAPSGRLTTVASILSTNIREKVRSGQAAPDRDRISGSISASYLFADGWRLRASYRDGFRVPTFNDLYYARVGNRLLQPEKAHQLNIGLTWDTLLGGKGSLVASADAYYNRVKDKIVAIPTMFIWKMHNVGVVNMAGLDLSVSCSRKLLPWMDMHADLSYSLQHAIDVTDPEAKNYRHQIQYTPRHCGSSVVSLEMPWVNVSYTLNAVGERYSTVQNNDAGRIDPYADHSLALSRGFSFGACRPWKLDIGVEALNLGNVNYEIVRYYPMAGRNYRMTIKITY